MYENNAITNKNMKILVVSAEVAPFAKTGGLADVAGSLPKALATHGNDVRVVMPRYRGIDKISTRTDFPVKIGDRRATCIVRETELEADLGTVAQKVPVYFVDNYHYFDRDGLYMHHDDAERFIFFCRAVLEMLPHINFQPDVIHCNDWHTGPICAMLNTEYYRQQRLYSKIATIFTIHNLKYQGHYSRDVLHLMNLPESYFTPDKLEFWGQVNFMKAGLVYSDVINTVSNTYAEEIQTEEYGEGLEGLLRRRSQDLFGIVNGISYEEFNPQKDPRIYRNYSYENFGEKRDNKFALQREMQLPVKDLPVFGIVTRLVDQKGLELLETTAQQIMANDVQMVVLGEGDPRYEKMFTDLQQKYPDKVAVYIGFDAVLAQRIYAGADLFLMPSRYEPCGLGQIISMRYGTVPIVRATGGLADTVFDYNMKTHSGNGFSFVQYSPEAFLDAVNRGLHLYWQHPESWQELVKRIMQLDYSWNKAAAEYMEIFHRAVQKRGQQHHVA